MALAPDPRQPAAPTAGKPTTTAPKVSYVVSQPAAPTSGGGATGGSLFDTANARAAAATNAVVAGIQAQQNIINQQALLRAAQQGQLGLASSRYLEGLHLPERTTADYARAAAAQTAAAAGYSGGLQQTVSDAAALVQKHLDAAGSPQAAYNQGEAAGNALYALGGTLPAAQFGVTGPTIAAGLRALPAQALGYGQQLALGQLGQGQQQAAQLNADIIAARAKQPTLAGDYLDSLLAAQAKAQADAETAAYHNATLTQRGQIATATIQQREDAANRPQFRGTLSTGITMYDPSTGKFSVVAEPQRPPAATQVKSFGSGGVMRVNPDGSVEILREPTVTAPTPHTRVVSDSTGQWLIDSATGARISKVGGPSSSTRAPSVAAGTATPVLHTGNSAYNGVASDQYGNPINYGTKAKPAYHISPGWHWGKGGQPVKNAKSVTASSRGFSNSDVASLAGDLSSWHTGITGTANGVPQIDDGSKKTWGQAYTSALTRGPSTKAWRKKALTLVNAEYGTPQSLAQSAATAAKSSGIGLTDAVRHVLEAQADGSNSAPVNYMLAAIAKAYRQPLEGVRSLASQLSQPQAWVGGG